MRQNARVSTKNLQFMQFLKLFCIEFLKNDQMVLKTYRIVFIIAKIDYKT